RCSIGISRISVIQGLSHGGPILSHSLFQFDSSPILRAALDAGPGGPGDAGFIDVFTDRGVGFVAVVDDQVEADDFPRSGRDADFIEGNGGLDAVASARAVGKESHVWRG